MATIPEQLPDTIRLSPRVIRILGDNPGKFTLQGTNTYLLGTGHKRILIDTGEGKPAWLHRLDELLKDEGATVSQVLITHKHHDHVGGVSDLLKRCPDAHVYKAQPDGQQYDIADGQVFTVKGATLKAMHTPGHTTDHVVFLLEDEDAMFAGDNILGQGTSVFEDLDTYLRSLERMQTAFHGRIYPGHGPVVEHGRARIEEYIAHRKMREEQVIHVLQTGEPERITNMVQIIYKDYPQSLHGPAQHGVLQILEKLRKAGQVEEQEGAWRLAAS